MTNTVFQLFKELNQVPRPSWHEERVADWLCQFAESHQLRYKRDAHNCMLISKAGTAGHEKAPVTVLHAHMDMVCVADEGKEFNPLTDPIEAYVDNGWMKARGTSLGADNGMGLCMALAVMASTTLEHGPLELFVTTNEEDGMTGAANVAPDFVTGRRMIDLDSEDYDTITTGAAGAYLQNHSLPLKRNAAPKDILYNKVSIYSGPGGHSGVDINKGRNSAVKDICLLLRQMLDDDPSMVIAEITAGEANASIPSRATAIVGIRQSGVEKKTYAQEPKFQPLDEKPETIIQTQSVEELLRAVDAIPYGVIKMSERMEGTVETSNNIGVIRTESDHFHLTTHTRSFIDETMIQTGQAIARTISEQGGSSEIVMSTPAWQERTDSPFMQLVEQTFVDVLGFRPRKVEMHFVMEMGYFVERFPGIQIIPIGPRILEPHSTNERVEISTIENIWKVLVELLRRMATEE